MRKMLMTMLAGFIGSMALAAEFFVDAKNGNDANGGTEQLPVRSLARAAELATGSSDGTVTVTVLPGFYGEDEGTDLSMVYTSASGAQANYRVVLATGNTKTVTFKARDGKAVTHIVGKKPANPWGLYDMYGLVYEFCLDWADESDASNSPVVDPIGPDTGTKRICCGGAYNCGVPFLRSAVRTTFAPQVRYQDDSILGFRLAAPLPEP